MILSHSDFFPRSDVLHLSWTDCCWGICLQVNFRIVQCNFKMLPPCFMAPNAKKYSWCLVVIYYIWNYLYLRPYAYPYESQSRAVLQPLNPLMTVLSLTFHATNADFSQHMLSVLQANIKHRASAWHSLWNWIYRLRTGVFFRIEGISTRVWTLWNLPKVASMRVKS